MRRTGFLFAVVGILLIGVLPAGAVGVVHEVEFDVESHTGGSGTFYMSGYGVGDDTAAFGEFEYYHPHQDGVSNPFETRLRIHDLKCMVVVPSDNTSHDTDYNVLVIGRLEVLADEGGNYTSARWGSLIYAPDEWRFGGSRPLGAGVHESEPSCNLEEFFYWTNPPGQWHTSGFFDAGFVTVNEIEPLYDGPPKKVSFSETYQLPGDRPLVEDQGWLNIGCGGGEFEWPTEPGVYETPGVLYEMDSGKLDASWKAKYVGEGTDGRWLYEMTQDFDLKKAVFESGTNWLYYEAEDDWYFEWIGSGDYFDVESAVDFDRVVVGVVNPYEPIGPGNVEPVNGDINTSFFLYDDATGELADWITIDGTFTDGEFAGTQEGTCNG